MNQSLRKSHYTKSTIYIIKTLRFKNNCRHSLKIKLKIQKAKGYLELITLCIIGFSIQNTIFHSLFQKKISAMCVLLLKIYKTKKYIFIKTLTYKSLIIKFRWRDIFNETSSPVLFFYSLNISFIFLNRRYSLSRRSIRFNYQTFF